jgi:hypothetical protein
LPLLALSFLATRFARADERPPPPKGWVVVPLGVLDDDENNLCTNRSVNREWETTNNDKGVVTLTPRRPISHDRDQAWPPTQPAEAEAAFRKAGFDDGRLRGLDFLFGYPDGWLAGFNRGEFGGGLSWVSRTGVGRAIVVERDDHKRHPQNVHAMVAIGPRFLVLQGLAHMGTNEGNAAWLEKDRKGRWGARFLVDLGAQPFGILSDGEGSWLVGTNRRLLRLDANGRTSTLAVIPRAFEMYLYPYSLARDAQGTIFVAARHYALRGFPRGSTYSFELLAPADCPRMTFSPPDRSPDHCTCVR